MTKEIKKSITSNMIQEPGNLEGIHKLLTSITEITTHIESQNETIIQANRKLREENVNLELQLKALVDKNKEMHHEVQILIHQNKEFRESLQQCKTENFRLQGELEKQNTRMRLVIEALKGENSRLRQEVNEGIKLLRWSEKEAKTKAKLPSKTKTNPWKFLCPMSQKSQKTSH